MAMLNQHAEVLICGGGIIGLTLARELLIQGASNIVILEKEEDVGKHASGRNSGILHAGIYYPEGSLKAKLCLAGNFLLKTYCQEKQLPLLETGKTIVAKDAAEIEILHKLYHRAIANGAKVELIDATRLGELEPYAKTTEQALYSYYTCSIDPKLILKHLAMDLIESKKVRIETCTEFLGVNDTHTVLTNQGPLRFDLFINAAGAYSDRVAHAFGLADQYRFIPFKGTYRKLGHHRSFMVKGNIYPVPNLENPFLGVHFSRNIHGDVYVGPTAMPAFGREHYNLFSGCNTEAFRILYNDVILFLKNAKFREVALTEPRKYFASQFFKEAQTLVRGLKLEDIEPCDKVGIRPQLVDWERKELVMDFLILKDQATIHILNAISPAFTSSMAFAKFVINEYM